jgi:putative acetyltransferase
MALVNPHQLMIQKAKAGDAYAVSRIISANTLRNENNIFSRLQKEVWLKYSSVEKVRQKILSRPTFCAFFEGQIIGTIAIDGEELFGLFVHPEFQRLGIGTRLLSFAEKYARALGLESLHLNATQNAKDFYKKNAYSEIGPVSVTVDHVEFSEIRMKKRLYDSKTR